jgi:hypothetical protein
MLALALLALALQVPDSAQFAAESRRLLAGGRHAEMHWPALDDVKAQAESLYRASEWQPLWLEGGRPTAPARALAGTESRSQRWPRQLSRGTMPRLTAAATH